MPFYKDFLLQRARVWVSQRSRFYAFGEDIFGQKKARIILVKLMVIVLVGGFCRQASASQKRLSLRVG